jgi:hypothetical protein
VNQKANKYSSIFIYMALSFDQAYPVLYKGWDQASARADFNATGGQNKAGYNELVGGGSSSGGSSGGVANTSNAIDTAKQLLSFQQSANQPAIQSLQASIPETTAKFATARTSLENQKVPLEARYKTLLDTIVGNQATDINQQNLTTSREFGRRGIPTTSGLFEQTIGEKTRPINQYYTGQATTAGISKEENLTKLNDLVASLTGQETEASRAITNAIAQLQAGDSSGAVTQALSLLAQNQNKDQATSEQAWKEKVYKETTLPESTYLQNKPYYNPSTGSSTDDGWT